MPVSDAASTEASSVVVIRNATLIRGTDAAPLHDAMVVIRGSRIASIGRARAIRLPAGAAVVDGRGKFIVPGLIDTHMHIASSVGTPRMRQLLAFSLAHGITGIRDASGLGRERDLVELRRQIERGEILAPRIYVSGTASPQNVARHQAAGLADLVNRLRDLGVNGIKVRNLTSVQTDTVIRAAAAASLSAFGHLYGVMPSTAWTSRALDLGATGVMHISGLGPGQTIENRTVSATGWQRDWLTLYLRWADATSDEEMRLMRALLESKAWLEPTLVVEAFVVYGDRYRNHPENQLVSQLWGQSYEQSRAGFPNFTGQDLDLARHAFGRMQGFVRRFHEAGGMVITGSDMLPWPAAGVHEELRLLVDAGLSPLAALQAATRNPARALGWDAVTGTVEVGKEADLLLLDANPLMDITNTKRIHAVVRAGRVIHRATLDSMVARDPRAP